ncbi:MAG: hypothetical protein WBP29_11970 [Candidatus Zixiibacteriota bacterium]
MNEKFIVSVERLRDDLVLLSRGMKKKYPKANSQVVSIQIRTSVAKLAESWFVEFSPVVSQASGAIADHAGDLNVHFQRLLTYSEHASLRSKYDQEFKDIANNYQLNLVIPLKQALKSMKGRPIEQSPDQRQVIGNRRDAGSSDLVDSIFVGMSFAEKDGEINTTIIDCLEALGHFVETGEKPRADKISDKVKRLIDKHRVFVGIFTCRDKIARKKKWTTSTWVVEEKAYAIGKRKRLILLRENGVETIGGLQGDYEYIDFDRQKIHLAIIKILQLFEIESKGIRR